MEDLLSSWTGIGAGSDSMIFLRLFILLVVCLVIYIIGRTISRGQIAEMAKKTKTQWDDRLVETRFFRKLAILLPIIVFSIGVDDILQFYPDELGLIRKVLDLILILAIARLVFSFIDALKNVLSRRGSYMDKPLNSYAQITKILLTLYFGILIFSVLTGKSPLYFLTALGAMSAILILLFRDTLLGFMASIQLATNDMVQVGDWITMEKYGADGTVQEINLATIKVKNFDLTITTIPTYALISDSFKNWRNLDHEKGRRIKRSINIKMNSVRFCTEEMLDHFQSINLLGDYVREKRAEFASQNTAHIGTHSANRRSLTNVGIFRKYLEFYLKNHPKLEHSLTTMVRQLDPNEYGLPLEIYAFSAEKNWVMYEGVISDIFDHIIAIAPEFHVELFERPASSDILKQRVHTGTNTASDE